MVAKLGFQALFPKGRVWASRAKDSLGTAASLHGRERRDSCCWQCSSSFMHAFEGRAPQMLPHGKAGPAQTTPPFTWESEKGPREGPGGLLGGSPFPEAQSQDVAHTAGIRNSAAREAGPRDTRGAGFSESRRNPQIPSEPAIPKGPVSA